MEIQTCWESWSIWTNRSISNSSWKFLNAHSEHNWSESNIKNRYDTQNVSCSVREATCIYIRNLNCFGACFDGNFWISGLQNMNVKILVVLNIYIFNAHFVVKYTIVELTTPSRSWRYLDCKENINIYWILPGLIKLLTNIIIFNVKLSYN